MSKTNEPAFPLNVPAAPKGLTKRELIAAMAMQGSLANSDYNKWLDKNTTSHEEYNSIIAQVSVMQADALLAELEKESK